MIGIRGSIRIAAALLLIAAFPSQAQMQTIRNDQFWKDAGGNFIYSQGGGVIKVGDTWPLSGWTKKSVSGIKVTNGTMRVGVQSSGTTSQWLALDDFELVKSDPVGVERSIADPRLDQSGTSWRRVHSQVPFGLEAAETGSSLEVRRIDGRPVGRLPVRGSQASLQELHLPEGIYLVRSAK